MRRLTVTTILIVLILAIPGIAPAGPLAWPIGCIPGVSCQGSTFVIGYPDTDGNGKAFDCSAPGYTGHTGTDIYVAAVEDRVPVLAAADGVVERVADGRYDRCPNAAEADCLFAQQPPPARPTAGSDPWKYCSADDGCISWGFDAGNFVFLRHPDRPEAAYTLYAHLRTGSVTVVPGQQVKRGKKLAEVGSSGNSLTPHLHFGVWQMGSNGAALADPWAGPCGPNSAASLWQYNPPYRADIAVTKSGRGAGTIASTTGEISCGPLCSASFLPGGRLTLTATPDAGSEFVGWQGACSGNEPTCTVSADSALTSVTATFRDTIPPRVSSFAVALQTTTLTVPVTSFTATDNIRVTGYLVTDSPDRPPLNAREWSSAPPEAHTCAAACPATLYAWARDASGNISLPLSATVVCGSDAIPVAATIPLAPKPL